MEVEAIITVWLAAGQGHSGRKAPTVESCAGESLVGGQDPAVGLGIFGSNGIGR